MADLKISTELKNALSGGVTFEGGPVEIAGAVDTYQIHIQFCNSDAVNKGALRELASMINAEGFGSNTAVYNHLDGHLSLSAGIADDRLDEMRVIAEIVAIKLGITFEETNYDWDSFATPPEAACESKGLASYDSGLTHSKPSMGVTI